MSSKKHKKPWYARWWAIVLFIFIGLYFLGSLGNDDSNYQTDNSYDNYQDSNIQNIQEEKEPVNTDRTKFSEISSEPENEILDDYDIGKFSRDYDWEYEGYTYGLTLNLYTKVNEIFQDRERVR